ncbi:SH3 domain-containing protein [Kineothrix sp. MB12-C1]|uniref:SH3 domain-containing protein n=1 Tax=Kineothrix sp. MB12-C1 TaxID=3070215 RepID=UPI0027D23A66|nr:SH3 domain-containing protein [Kineothrix sp. MB12-C1]WMC93626.1 SH3 domain-containing protein [Kineothrix sp. MB12-C1]
MRKGVALKGRMVVVLAASILALGLYGCSQPGEAEVEEAMAESGTVAARVQEAEKKADTKNQIEPESVMEVDGEKEGKTEDKAQSSNGQKVSEDSVNTEDAETSESEEIKKDFPPYTVSVLESAKVMYAVHPVNIRKGPSTDYERIGSLNRGQEVLVSGQADTGWFEISYEEEKGYVSNRYLQDNMPVEEAIPTAAENEGQPAGQPVQAVTEVKSVAGVILVGDSRFVQMQENVGENSCTWIAESGKGYNWFNENAIARIDGSVGKGSKILINLGVNDPGNLNNYLTLVNAKAAEWVGKGARVYYASVNPVWENPYVTEEQVEYFNSQLQNGLSGDVQWIDSHSYLDSIGYKLVDGLHYNAETYQNLYAYFMSCL